MFVFNDWLTLTKDDHDIMDGYGSYPDDLQTSPLFSLSVLPCLLHQWFSWGCRIGYLGYFYFLLFQQFIVRVFSADADAVTDILPGKLIGGRYRRDQPKYWNVQ